MNIRLGRIAWGLALAGGLAVAILLVFWDALLGRGHLWGPDSGAYGYVYLRQALPGAYLGNWWPLDGLGRDSGPIVFVPYHLLLWLVDPLRCQLWTYIASIVLTAAAAWYFLAGRGIRGAAAVAASLAAGFTPHTVTLISAGHIGKLQLMPFAMLLLAALDRAVTRRSLAHYALAGLSVAYGFISGADIMFVFVLVGAAYGLYLWVSCRPRPGGTAGGWTRHILIHAAGVAVAGCFAFAAASIWVQNMVQTVLPSRMHMAETAGAVEEKVENKWEFATNWSLPPEELLEFVAPGVFGWQTVDPRAPYWGRLGRTLGWETHHRGLMNLRQHTVYLGVVSIVFAAYAVAWAFRRRQLRGGAGSEDLPTRRSQVLFWGAVAAVGVMLALGRYFVLYRVFYALPFASNMRAPVKFLHVVEVALCILFAFGLDAFLRALRPAVPAEPDVPAAAAKRRGPGRTGASQQPAGRDRLPGWMALACGVACLTMLFAMGVATGRLNGLRLEWSSLGMSAYAAPLEQRMLDALGHGAALFGLCAAVLAIGRFARPRAATALMLSTVIIAAAALDFALVAKPYVMVWDEGMRYRSDALTDRLAAEPAGYRVAMAARGGAYDRWRVFVFPMNGVTLTDSDPSVLTADDQSLRAALKDDPMRFWMLTSTRSVIGPASGVGLLTNAPGVEVAGRFEITGDGGAAWAPGSGSQLWLRLRDALPRAAVYHAWSVLPREAMPGAMADRAWNPRERVLVECDPVAPVSGGTCTPARIVRFGYSRVVIETDDPSGGVLMLNDRFDPAWRASIDGRPAPVLRCNYLVRGVAVPPGRHTVEFDFRKYEAAFAFAAGAPLLWMGWFLGASARGWMARRHRV